MTLPGRGAPDFLRPRYALAAGQPDPGLAAEFSALGFSRLDSNGRPFFFDDFSGGLARGWVPFTAGAGAAVQAYGLNGFVGPECARLNPGTSGAGQSAINLGLSTIASYRVGVEIAAYIETVLPVDFEVSLSYGAGASGFARLGYDGALTRWYIKNQLGVKIAMPSLNVATSLIGGWSVAKMVVDFSTRHYIAGIIQQWSQQATRFDLSANLMATVTGGGGLGVGLAVDGSGVNQSVDFGYIVVTIDEP